MLTLLCLIFIGQSVASSVMFYSMPSMNTGVMQEHGMHGAIHSTQTSDSEDAEDCCSQELYCFASACSMLNLFSGFFNTDFVAGTSLKIASTDSLIASQKLTSLYRPPILS